MATKVGTNSYECRVPGLPDPSRSRTTLAVVQDETYKKLFAFPRMVEDLLRALITSEWIDDADFSTLRKLSSEYVSDDLRRRLGDAVWRVRLGHGWLHVLVLLEFQSRDDPDMALRILEYTALLYRELGRNDRLGADRLRPPVLPVVLYHGAARWKAALEVGKLISPVGPSLAPYQPSQRYLVLDERRVEEDDLPSRNLMAAVVGLEQSRSLADLVRVVEALQEWLPDPRDAELKSAFAEWVRRLAKRLAPVGGEDLPPARTLEDVRMNLEERVAQWPKEWLAQGLAQGLEHERALLCRMARTRFGADTSEQLSAVLAGVADQDRFADIGDWLVRCDTGQEFLARAASAANEQERSRG